MKRVCGVCVCVVCVQSGCMCGAAATPLFNTSFHPLANRCCFSLKTSYFRSWLWSSSEREGGVSDTSQAVVFFLLCAITPEHSLDCCQDLPCKTWFLFSHDGHFYDILFVTTGTSEGIWWHRWMLLPQFLLIHFQRVWFPLIHHFFPLSHTFSFSPWGLWLGSYLTWPISLFYPRVPRLNTPLNVYTCLSVSSGRMCVPPLCVCVFVCVCVCARACSAAECDQHS